MKLKQFLRHSTISKIKKTNQGFTLVELIVTSLIASTVLALSLQLITDVRKQFLADQLRATNNQTLRIGMNLIGTSIRSAGENLENNTDLPVISVIDKDDAGNDTDHDQLIIQKQFIKDTLRLCADLNNGETQLTVFTKPNDPNCAQKSSTVGGFDVTVNKFRDYRRRENGNNTSVPSVGNCTESVSAYIHDPVNKRGEFFEYAFETSDDNGNHLHRCDSDQWEFEYTNKDNPKIYLLEEQRFRLVDNPNNDENGKVLELIKNRQDEEDKILRITNNIQDLELEVRIDGVSSTSLNPNFMTREKPWNSIRNTFEYVSVRLQAKDAAESDLLERKDSSGKKQDIDILAKFFPRNAGSFSTKNPPSD